MWVNCDEHTIAISLSHSHFPHIPIAHIRRDHIVAINKLVFEFSELFYYRDTVLRFCAFLPEVSHCRLLFTTERQQNGK